MAYYYRTEDGKAVYSLKTPSGDESLIAMTEEEYEALSALSEPTEGEMEENDAIIEMAEIRKWLSDNDYVINKHTLGEYSDEDERWTSYKSARKEKLKRYNELEEKLGK